jgi:nitroreductase
MSGATSDVWETMSTARAIRRFTDEPVDDATLTRCLEAATWAPSGANAQAWHFIVLRSPEQRAIVAKAAAQALEVVEPAGHVVVGWPKGKHGPVRPAGRGRQPRPLGPAIPSAREEVAVMHWIELFGAL